MAAPSAIDGRLSPPAPSSRKARDAEAQPGKRAREASTGYKELKGQQPYRADWVAGVSATVGEERGKRPVRNEHGQLVFAGHKDFRPVLTPEQVIRLGSFGGTYFRPISSAVTGESYSDAHQEFEWCKGIPATRLTRSWARYDVAANRYKVKCGGSLDMWESSGWISDIDPYGWFQWYCRFFEGRRSSDDARQIGRWLKSAGPSGRFRNQLSPSPSNPPISRPRSD